MADTSEFIRNPRWRGLFFLFFLFVCLFCFSFFLSFFLFFFLLFFFFSLSFLFFSLLLFLFLFLFLFPFSVSFSFQFKLVRATVIIHLPPILISQSETHRKLHRTQVILVRPTKIYKFPDVQIPAIEARHVSPSPCGGRDGKGRTEWGCSLTIHANSSVRLHGSLFRIAVWRCDVT